jgi:hypothetical protein
VTPLNARNTYHSENNGLNWFSPPPTGDVGSVKTKIIKNGKSVIFLDFYFLELTHVRQLNITHYDVITHYGPDIHVCRQVTMSHLMSHTNDDVIK